MTLILVLPSEDSPTPPPPNSFPPAFNSASIYNHSNRNQWHQCFQTIQYRFDSLILCLQNNKSKSFGLRATAIDWTVWWRTLVLAISPPHSTSSICRSLIFILYVDVVVVTTRIQTVVMHIITNLTKLLLLSVPLLFRPSRNPGLGSTGKKDEQHTLLHNFFAQYFEMNDSNVFEADRPRSKCFFVPPHSFKSTYILKWTRRPFTKNRCQNDISFFWLSVSYVI